jgi:hypothetical protein
LVLLGAANITRIANTNIRLRLLGLIYSFAYASERRNKTKGRATVLYCYDKIVIYQTIKETGRQYENCN